MAQIVLDRLTAKFQAGEILATGSQHGNEWARIRRDAWVAVATFLRDDPTTKMEMFTDLTAVDRFSTEPRFDVVVHLYSVSLKHRVRLYGGVPENDPTIDTLVPLWAGADWYEREAYDLYGVLFSGHPDLRRILTDYGFEGHPLRKDFPLSGFVELRYDEEQKRVVYEPVKLQQEFRNFDFLSPWEGTDYVLPGDEKARG